MDETQVSPTETQIPVEQTAQTTPEVAEPEATPAESQQPDEQGQDPREKAVKSLTRRVDRLTAAKYQEQARATQLAQEAEQLRQRLAQYEQPQQPEALTPDRVLPIAQQMAAQLREQEKVRESVTSVLHKGKTIDGFDTACNTVNETLPFYERNGAPSAFLQAVLEGETPEKVLHYLGTNPDVVEDLAGLSPTKLARQLDRIERKLSEPPEPKASTAPKPVTPIRGSSRDNGELSDDLSIEEWNKRFQKMRRGG